MDNAAGDLDRCLGLIGTKDFSLRRGSLNSTELGNGIATSARYQTIILNPFLCHDEALEETILAIDFPFHLIGK